MAAMAITSIRQLRRGDDWAADIRLGFLSRPVMEGHSGGRAAQNARGAGREILHCEFPRRRHCRGRSISYGT